MKKQLHNDKVYTVQEAADAIGISASQMYQVIRIKGFPVVRISDKVLRIPKEKFWKWIGERAEKGWYV